MFTITTYFVSGLDCMDWPDYIFLKRLNIWIILVHILFSKEYQTASVTGPDYSSQKDIRKHLTLAIMLSNVRIFNESIPL